MWLRDVLSDLASHFRGGVTLPVTPDLKAMPVVQVPDGERLVNLEMLREFPMRMRGTVALASVEDLSEQVRRFNAEAVDPVYQIMETGAFCCIFNDDRPESPGWRDHRAHYTPADSDAWKAWKAIDGKWLQQLEMAEFIQDRAPDFVKPTGGDMLDLAQNFDVVRGGRFTSGVRLDNGMTRLTVEQTAQSATIDIPEIVALGMTVFRNSSAFQIRARFRWRIQDGSLRLGFKIVDREKIIEAAVNELCDDLVRLLPNHKILRVDSFPQSVSALPAL